MNGYLLSIIGTVLLSAILTSIIPEGKTAKMIKGVAKLACLLVIIAPVPKFLTSFGSKKNANSDKEFFETFFKESVIETDVEFIKYYSEMRIRSAEIALADELLEKFSIDVEIKLFSEQLETPTNGVYDLENIKITRIFVREKTDLKEEERMQVWEYLTKNYCSEVQIE